MLCHNERWKQAVQQWVGVKEEKYFCRGFVEFVLKERVRCLILSCIRLQLFTNKSKQRLHESFEFYALLKS